MISKITNVEFLFYVWSMIEFENNRIGNTTINTWVFRQVFEYILLTLLNRNTFMYFSSVDNTLSIK
jgi:hypothetical protein